MVKFRSFIYFLFIAIVLFSIYSCTKDYSYEGGEQQDMIPIQDSIVSDENGLPVCLACNNTDNLSLSSWAYKIGTNNICGTITKGIMNAERNAFTFFGPSACSADTGLIITAYFNTSFYRDLKNVSTNSCDLQYYDNTTSIDIFQSWPLKRVSITVESYNHQTSLFTGSFQGYVLNAKKDTVQITAGKFKVIME